MVHIPRGVRKGSDEKITKRIQKVRKLLAKPMVKEAARECDALMGDLIRMRGQVSGKQLAWDRLIYLWVTTFTSEYGMTAQMEMLSSFLQRIKRKVREVDDEST